jgi:hypothetical protein
MTNRIFSDIKSEAAKRANARRLPTTTRRNRAMAVSPLPTAELIRQLLDYDKDTGIFIWKPRPEEMFQSKRQFVVWNKRYADHVAGSKNQDGYTVIVVDYRIYFAHRLAWLHFYGEEPPSCLDHIDGDQSNNCISNLRPATPFQNAVNRREHRNNKVGLKGVTYRFGRYYANIMIGGKQIQIGSYPTAEEAHAAYCKEAVKRDGKFTRDKIASAAKADEAHLRRSA